MMQRRQKQQGFILITTLFLLLMLTVLAVSQTASNTSQTQIATNATDSEISFEKAEGALNEAINRMLQNNYSIDLFANNSNGLYVFDSTKSPLWETVNWEGTGVIRSFSGMSGLQANYIIEQLPSVVQPGQSMRTLTRMYRITGRAVGQNGVSSVLLQSTIQLQQ